MSRYGFVQLATTIFCLAPKFKLALLKLTASSYRVLVYPPQISEAEMDIDGKDFKFHCHPYFLW